MADAADDGTITAVTDGDATVDGGSDAPSYGGDATASSRQDGAPEAGDVSESGVNDAAPPDVTIDAGVCGNGYLDPGEQCDQGTANIANAYGNGLCTTNCMNAPYCGDGIVNGPEICDSGGSGSTALGSCNPICTGYYQKRIIKLTSGPYPTNVGGIAGADSICQGEFGGTWKALLVGGSRRATVTPFTGDSPQDWVIQKYTYYYNADDQFLWRTDVVPLLGVSGGQRQSLAAATYDGGGAYVWSGWATDWTTMPDGIAGKGTCLGWTSSATTDYGSFAFTDLSLAASEPCGPGTRYFILCVQQ
jgi:hypothetical protein